MKSKHLSPKRGKSVVFTRTLMSAFTIMAGCSLLTFSGDQPAKAQTLTTPGPMAPMTRRISASLVTPASALAYFGSASTHTNGAGHWVGYAPEIRALARGLGGNRLPANEFTRNVAKYVRDNIETEFRFGLGKGARGAVIDQSGTAFDQADLMVKLLRAGGVSANYQVGTLTLNADQFGKWTGLVTYLNEPNQTVKVNAAAACRFLSDGGVPAMVNGASTCVGLKGSLSSVTLAHAWVVANGTAFDPSYKTHKIFEGIDLPNAMGCGNSANNQCGDQVTTAGLIGAKSGSIGGAPTLSHINQNEINNKLKSYAVALQSYLSRNTYFGTPLRQLKLAPIIGGKEILVAAPLLSATEIARNHSVVSQFNGDVPDQFRARLRVQLGRVDKALWADELSGRRLQVFPAATPVRVDASTKAKPITAIFLDGALLQSFPAEVVPNTPSYLPPHAAITIPTIALTSVLPWPSMGLLKANTRAETYRLPRGEVGPGGAKSSDVVYQLGARGAQASSHLANSGVENMHCAVSCGGSTFQTLTDSFLNQSSAAISMTGAVAKAGIGQTQLLGVIGENNRSLIVFNVTRTFTVVHNSSSSSTLGAISKTVADTDSFLEGSVIQQHADSRTSLSGISTLANPSPLSYYSPNVKHTYIYITPASAQAVALTLVGVQEYSFELGAGSTPSLEISQMGLSGRSAILAAGGVGQLQWSGDQFANTFNWYYKGGGAALQITPVNPRDSANEKKFSSALGESRVKDGNFNISTDSELTVGPKDSPLTFRRSFSSAGLRRSSSEISRLYDPTSLSKTNELYDISTYMNESPYIGPDSAIGHRIGGGWRHNFQETAAFENSGIQYLKPNLGINAATTLAYLVTALDLNLNSSFGARLASMFTVAWWGEQLIGNVVALDSTEQQQTFVRQPDGTFKDWSDLGSLATIVQTRVPASGGQCSPVGHLQRQMDYEGSSIQIRGRDGTLTTYESGVYSREYSNPCNYGQSVGDYKSTGSTYVPTQRVYSGGLVLNYKYFWGPGTSQNNSSYWSYSSGLDGVTSNSSVIIQYSSRKILQSVALNTGQSLNFSYSSEIENAVFSRFRSSSRPTTYWQASISGGSLYARLTSVTGSDGRVLTFDWSNCSQYIGPEDDLKGSKTCDVLTVTRPDKTVVKYDYTPGPDSPQMTDPTYRPRFLLRRWYSPSDQNTPIQSVRYDEVGHVASVSTKNSQGTTSTSSVFVGSLYGGENERRVEQANALGGVSVAIYDERGQITRTVNESGVQNRYEYDALGRLVTAFFEESAGASLKAGCLAPVGRRSNCWRTEYEYDDRGNVIKETKYPYAWEGDFWWGKVEVTDAAYSPDFNKPLWTRGPYAPAATEAEKNYKKTSFEYNAQGLVVKKTQPYVFDSRRQIWTNPVVEYEYDGYGRLIREKKPTGVWISTGYGENGQPIWCQTSVTRSSQPSGLNLRSTSKCTAAGDIAEITDARGTTTAFTYDQMRRKISEAGPYGARKRFEFDKDGNAIRHGAFDGTNWKDIISTYSPTGKLLTQTDPAGDQLTFSYDALDRVSIRTDPEGRQVLFCYNASGQILEEWRGSYLTTGQCGQSVNQASASTPQRYIKNVYGGPDNRITEAFDPNNNKTTFNYQGNGEKIYTVWPDLKVSWSLSNKSYSNGSSGSIFVETDRQGRSQSIYYDYLGRKFYHYSMTEASKWDNVSIYHYDSESNRTWAGEYNSENGYLKLGTFTEYDAADRPATETSFHSFPLTGPGGVPAWSYEDSSYLQFEYDANDNRTQVRSYNTSNWANDFTTNYSYDALNRMTSITFPNGGVTYEYDLLGRKTVVRRSNGTSTDYAYEAEGDLDWIRHLFQGGTSAYEANDNWMGIDYGYDRSGRQTLMSSTDSRILGPLPGTGAYGTANALNQVANVPERATVTWSAAGNMSNDGKGTNFTHDGRNRLTKVVKADNTTIVHVYNADGLRVETVKNPIGYNASGMPIGGARTRYWLLGSEEIADVDGNKRVMRRYISGAALDERVAQIEADGRVTFIHTDRQNSVVAISDAAGNVVSRRGYGVYGETDGAQFSGGGAHPFGYTGRRWDTDLNLYYYRARWYDPQLGTFLETDPIGARDYINLYAYVGLEPGNGTDPSGMYVCKGSQEQCAVIRDGLLEAQRARDSFKQGSAQFNRLNAAVNAYGSEGQKNGVEVRAAKLANETLGQVSKRGDKINVAFDFQQLYSASQATGGRSAGRSVYAGVIVHEGTHVWQHQIGVNMDVYRRAAEVAAYTTEAHLYRASGAWGRSVSASDEKQFINEGAHNSCQGRCDD